MNGVFHSQREGRGGQNEGQKFDDVFQSHLVHSLSLLVLDNTAVSVAYPDCDRIVYSVR